MGDFAVQGCRCPGDSIMNCLGVWVASPPASYRDPKAPNPKFLEKNSKTTLRGRTPTSLRKKNSKNTKIRKKVVFIFSVFLLGFVQGMWDWAAFLGPEESF